MQKRKNFPFVSPTAISLSSDHKASKCYLMTGLERQLGKMHCEFPGTMNRGAQRRLGLQGLSGSVLQCLLIGI